MSRAHRREKNPELVRQSLVDNACLLAQEKGLAAVSIQQVSAASGVTKGGLFHHFASKQELVDAVFAEMLSEFEAGIESLIAKDPEPHGRYTRAYLRMVIETNAQESSWSAIWVSMITDEALRSAWHRWRDGRLAHYVETDDSPALRAVRMAADGIWLAQLAGTHPGDSDGLHALLLEMTWP